MEVPRAPADSREVGRAAASMTVLKPRVGPRRCLVMPEAATLGLLAFSADCIVVCEEMNH